MNREHLGHFKGLEISRYKRESTGRGLIKKYRFTFLNCCLIWVSKH